MSYDKIAAAQLVKITDNWKTHMKFQINEIIRIQTNQYNNTQSYLGFTRLVFIDPRNNIYSSLDNLFALDPTMNSVEIVLNKALYDKSAYGRLCSAVYVCLPSEVSKNENVKVKGFFLFVNYELTSTRLFFSFNGLEIVSMPDINKIIIVPPILEEFRFILPYAIMTN